MKMVVYVSDVPARKLPKSIAPPRLFPLCFVALLMKILIYGKNTQKIHTFDRLVKPTDMCIFSIKYVGECVFSHTYFSWVKKTHMYYHRYFLWFCETNRSMYFLIHTFPKSLNYRRRRYARSLVIPEQSGTAAANNMMIGRISSSQAKLTKRSSFNTRHDEFRMWKAP